MQKVLVAEVGNITTIVNAFGELNTENPRLLGQGIAPSRLKDGAVLSGLKEAVQQLEPSLGPLATWDQAPFYVLAPDDISLQEIKELAPNIEKLTFTTSIALKRAAELIYEEVGEVWVFDVGGFSSEVLSLAKPSDEAEILIPGRGPLFRQTIEEFGVYSNTEQMAALVGEDVLREHQGADWRNLVRAIPESAEEIALSRELTSCILRLIFERHRQALQGDSFSPRWVVGTGGALSRLPNGLEIMANSIACREAVFFLDRDNIMASIGALVSDFRAGAWQILKESLGIEN